MKKKIILFLSFLFFPLGVSAAGSATIGGANQVELGSSVTVSVTLKNTAAWNVRINSSGSTSGCSQSFADATSNGKDATKTLSVTCKATSIGTIGFTVTGDITSSADGTTKNISLSKRVTVVPVRQKATDATLSSLTLEGYSIAPEFKSDVYEYTATVPSTTNNIKIDAKVNESHANLTGVGEYEVTEGMNTFEIVVTAEAGATKTYKIIVNVEDTNPIEVKIGEKSYTLIKNAKSLLQPDAYEEKTITINNMEIPAFYSEITKFTLVGVKDEAGKVFLAIYDEEKETYTLYNEIKADVLTFYFVDFSSGIEGYTKTTILIGDVEVPAYVKIENNRFAIVYGMRIESGEYNYYKYDTEEKTFQVWDNSEVEALEKDLETYKYACILFGGGLIFAFVLIICLLARKGKRKKRKDAKEKNSEQKKGKLDSVKTDSIENKNIDIIDRRNVEVKENKQDIEVQKSEPEKKKSSNEELFGVRKND